MAATVELAKVSAGPSGRVELAQVAIFGTPGGYVALTRVAVIAPAAAPATVEIVQVAGYTVEAFTSVSMWRERVDGVWSIPPWTLMQRVGGVWVDA